MYCTTPNQCRPASAGGRGGAGAGANPSFGVTVDYWLKSKPTSPITVQFLESNGTVIRTFASDAPGKKDSTGNAQADSAANAARAIQNAMQLAYAPADSVVHARAGANRFVWDLMYNGPKRIPDSINDDGSYEGAMAVPGDYTTGPSAMTAPTPRPYGRCETVLASRALDPRGPRRPNQPQPKAGSSSSQGNSEVAAPKITPPQR